MALDKKLWEPKVHDGIPPLYPCPKCDHGRLIRVADHSEETVESINARKKHPDWEPDWDEYLIAWKLACNNPRCRDPAFLLGAGQIEHCDRCDEVTGDEYSEMVNVCQVITIMPAPPILHMPALVPERVKRQMQASFTLYFQSPGSCLGAIRAALERVMDDQGIPDKDANGDFVSLHRRIKQLPSQWNEAVPIAEAVKWLGNAGAHDPLAVTHETAMDAYQMIEHVIDRFYGAGKMVAALAATVNATKGIA